MLINIKKVISNKEDYMNLLLLADPSEKMIKKYLPQSEMFVLYVNGEPVCEAVIVKISETVCELKNLATSEKYRDHGFAKQLLQHIFQNYKNTFAAMLVGTSNPAFYEKFGFQYSHTVDNFFIDNYPEPIMDNNVKCVDLTYLKKDLHTKAKALTRSEESITSLILDIAKKDERVRIVGMNGSRLNTKVPKDFFQDYDIVFLVNEYEEFIKDSSWINVFGRRLIMQTPDTFNDSSEKKYAYLMQFTDGNRIDLTIMPYESRHKYIKDDSLTKILLDKDKVLPNLAEPTDMSYWIKMPTWKDYEKCCNEFWWISIYIAKGLWRKEILYSAHHLESCVREELLKMISWKVGIENNFEISAGKFNKYLENYVSKETFEKIMRTYNISDYEHCWDSLFTMIELFRRNASFVAEKLEFTYNAEDDKNVYAFLRHIRSLPSNAKALYDENN